jgi:phosphatidyl-myo-inositol dimannoside synthase
MSMLRRMIGRTKRGSRPADRVESVVVLGAAPFLRGGIERLTWDVAASLREIAGEDRVLIAALVGDSSHRADRAPLAYEGSVRLTLRSKIRFTKWVLALARRSRGSLLLFFMHPNQAQIGEVAKRLFGTRYVVWAHGAEVWRSMSVLSRRALRRADCVFCSSDFTRERVVRGQGVAAKSAHTVHPSVSKAVLDRAARVSQAPSEAQPVILSVGRVSRNHAYKGFGRVVSALPFIAQKIPQVRYVVIGGGDAIFDLQRLADELGQRDSVEIRGDVSDEELWEAYEQARVFALPSQVTSRRRSVGGEGFGIVYAEAAAFGRPVVGSTQGGAAEAVIDGSTGLNVDPADIEALAEALLVYLNHPSQADRDGAAGRTHVLEDLTPDQFTARLRRILDPIGLVQDRIGIRYEVDPTETARNDVNG